METLKRQLAEPDRTAKTKREAALLLLTRTYPQAAKLAWEFLTDKTNQPARIAIAEAIAESGITRAEFVKPLLEMLTGAEPALRVPAANALSAFKDAGVPEEFIRLVTNRKTDRAVRLAVIGAMQRIFDKKAINTLVGLLHDPDEGIRNAACDSLAKLTNIRGFGRNPRLWRKWWQENKDKKRSDWLADLAESVVRTNLQLERENADLRARLAAAMRDLCAATPPASRDALLTGMLKDPVAEVRLVGAQLIRQRTGNAKPLPEPLRQQIRGLLSDKAPGVRREAALLLSRLNDSHATSLLAARLQTEQAWQVREAIYQGLGLLRDPKVWDLFLDGIAEKDDRVATAAAAALALVAEKNGISVAQRAKAATALKKRYLQSTAPEAAPLREALLAAMGQLKEKRLLGLIKKALKDPSAAVRLSAIKALETIGNKDNADAIAPLTADPDRGVRLAAILAIRHFGSFEHLETVLTRTHARLEPDEAIRQQAWAVVMELLKGAETGKLRAMADLLAQRDDAREQLIQVLKLWAGKVPPAKRRQWAAVRQRLGEELLKAGRPAEAARELGAVCAALAKADPPSAGEVWLKWVEALLAADDPSAVARIAESKDPKLFDAAVEALARRVKVLQANKDWDRLVRLAGSALRRLAERMAPARRDELQKALNEAQANQRKADRQRVAALVSRLGGSDAASRTQAERELLAMQGRAVQPLLAELQKLLKSRSPNHGTERAIVNVLAKLAPQLTGYDPAAGPADRLAIVEAWLKRASP